MFEIVSYASWSFCSIVVSPLDVFDITRKIVLCNILHRLIFTQVKFDLLPRLIKNIAELKRRLEKQKERNVNYHQLLKQVSLNK